MKRQLRVIENLEFAPQPQSETRLRAEPSQMTRIPAPQTRGDCVDGPRPCQWINCRYSLVGEKGTAERGKAYHFNTGDHDAPLDALAETCALDVADKGTHTLDEVAALLGVSRQRVQQISERAFVTFVGELRRRGIGEQDVHDALASHGENTEPEGLE